MIKEIQVWLLVKGACLGLVATVSAQTLTMQSGRFSLTIDEQSVQLSSGEKKLLECRGIEILDDAGKSLSVQGVSVLKKDKGALQKLKVGDALIEREFMPVNGGFRVEEKFTKLPSSALSRWYSSYAPVFENTWNYSPSVGGFVPDAYYKSPVVIAASERAAAAIIPDLKVLSLPVLKTCNHGILYDLTGQQRFIAPGFIPAEFWFHSVFRPGNKIWKPTENMVNAYYLFGGDNGMNLYRQSMRFLWETYGRQEQAVAAKQQQGIHPGYQNHRLLDDWRKLAWHTISSKEWLEVDLPDGSKGGAVSHSRWNGGNAAEFGSKGRPSYSFTAWFNALRTSYGMGIYARRTGDKEMLSRASHAFNVFANAPSLNGAFKCYAAERLDGSLHWLAGDGGGRITETGYLGYDMAWTALWMLRWRDAKLPTTQDVLKRCKEIGDFFLANQTPDGFVPSRYDEQAKPISEISLNLKAETSVIANFLLELHRATADPRYLAAARRALAFVWQEVAEPRQWYDFETFFSCAPDWPGENGKAVRKSPDLACPKSGLYPLNNLAMAQAVEAYLTAYQLTGEAAYLEKGEVLLDVLLGTQQVWSNPLMAPYGEPGLLIGGFTTQNSDSEWSDGRQAIFGPIILNYYRATGKPEYLERGIAAMRAQLNVNPSENFAHQGYPERGKWCITGFHWGTGSSVSAMEIEADFLGDLFVDVSTQTAVGINGLDVRAFKLVNKTIELTVSTPFEWEFPPSVRMKAPFDGTVRVNGQVCVMKDSAFMIPLSALMGQAKDDY
ncbi:MAG: hypothetical protein WCS43_02945 [Verrucomicrobiota bacterium]